MSDSRLHIKPLPSMRRLRETFRLDSTSPSGLRWRKRSRGRRADLRAGSRNGTGYWQVGLDGRNLRAHRVVYALATGSDPLNLTIDHINRDRLDNTPANLRAATHAENMGNQSSHGGTSRYVGVHLVPSSGRWIANITHEGKSIYIGSFRCETRAALAFDRESRNLRGTYAAANLLRVTR